MIKFKLISTDMENELVKELEEFQVENHIEIISIDYKPTSFHPDAGLGWASTIFHNVLITYKEKGDLK